MTGRAVAGGASGCSIAPIWYVVQLASVRMLLRSLDADIRSVWTGQ
uniref:Uncharacterized protein n=1 Tax=Anguilla anguilla TaxID=7936 RepID=A0A0E9TWD8_ANGAN